MSDYREFAIDLAQRAGDIMRTNFRLGMTKTWKADGTPLTVTDLMINDMVLNAVESTYDGHGLIGEEASSENGWDHDYVWVCDPVDGTFPFSHGTSTFTFSLALVHQGRSVLGVVNDPISERMFVAELGAGTTVNGEPTRVIGNDEASSMAIDLEDQGDTGSLRGRLRQRGAIVTTLCASIYAASRISTGEYAAMISRGSYVWDAAAASLIVTEAGGKATDIGGREINLDRNFRGWIATNGEIHDTLVDELARTTS